MKQPNIVFSRFEIFVLHINSISCPAVVGKVKMKSETQESLWLLLGLVVPLELVK